VLHNTILPILATQRITLEPNPTSVSDPSKGRPRWMEDYGHSPTSTTPSPVSFDGNVKVNFLVKVPEFFNLKASSPDKKIADNVSFIFMVLDSSQEYIMGLIDRGATVDYIREVAEETGINIEEKSLSDVLLRDTSQLESVSNLSMDYDFELHSEINIPINLEYTGDELHLYGFSYFKNSEELEGLPSSITGNYTYDLLISSDEDGNIGVPLFRNVFYIRDSQNTTLRPYYGPAHYHGPGGRPVGEDGYIGWMAGHPSSNQMGPKLEVRRARNYKVMSSMFSLISKEEAFSVSSLTGPSEYSTGDRLESYLSSVMNIDISVDKAVEMEERIKASVEATGRTLKATFVTRQSDRMTGIQVDTDNLENSCYRSVIGVDFLNILKYNSIFGDLLCFQENSGNKDFIDLSLYYTDIININVKRRRITEHPYEFNDVDTNIYTKFDKNTQDIEIVSASDSLRRNGLISQERIESQIIVDRKDLKNRLLSSRTSMAHLSEIELLEARGDESLEGGFVIDEISPYVRHFVLRDYDLFHNVNIGSYTYILEITLKDGIPMAIKAITSRLKQSILEIEKYIEKSEKPIVRDSRGNVIDGNFDLDTLQVTDEFRNDDSLTKSVDRAISSYISATGFLSGKIPSPTIMLRISNQLYPSSFNPEAVHKFRDVLSVLHSSIVGILKNQGFETEESIYHPDRVSTISGGKYTDNIRVSSNTNIVANSFTPSSVLVDYSVSEDEEFVPLAIPVLNTVTPFIEYLPAISLSAPASTQARFFFDNLKRPDNDSRVNEFGFFPNLFYTVDPITFSTDHNKIVSAEQGIINSAIPPAAMFLDFGEIEDSTTTKSSGGINFVMSKREYDNSTNNAKSAAKIMLSVLKNFDSSFDGSSKKGALYFPLQVQALNSVSFNLVGNKFSNVIFENFTGKEEVLHQSPDADQSLFNSICASFARGDDEHEFVEMNYESFKELVDSKNQLGEIFSQVNAMLEAKNSSFENKTEPTLEQQYLGKREIQKSYETSFVDPFQEEFAFPVIKSVTSEDIRINPVNLSFEDRKSTEFNKKFVFMKLERNTQNVGTTPVNNSLLLEV
tara:strand:- start:892 stop:4113 length:3222 start_codon:yes stop_codon:yes gene_type:complete